MSNLKYIGKNILNHDLILKKGDISGSLASTGSFGKVLGDGSDISNLPVSAINNATENRVVTIGATTSELDAESTLTFDGIRWIYQLLVMALFILQEVLVEMLT